MSQTIIVHHTIPFSDNEWGGADLIFYQWIPEDTQYVLTRTANNMTSRLWLDRSCISFLGELTDDILNKWANISVSKVFVEVEIADVSDELAQFIYDEREEPQGRHHGIQPGDNDYERLKNDYLELGKAVLQEAGTIFNRLISFARNYKDQYWLFERQFELYRLSSLNNQFDARARWQDHDSIRWCPPAGHVIHATIFNQEKSIHSEDWGKVQEFASKNSKPNIILELLANADLFISERRRRNAIIEAVTALEIAVANFCATPRFQGLRTDEELSRLNIINLKSQIDHIGFSSTVGYLLPLLFPHEVLPSNVLENSQKAIEQRNAVIHRGQRDIEPKLIQTLVSSVRRLCEILNTYTVRP